MRHFGFPDNASIFSPKLDIATPADIAAGTAGKLLDAALLRSRYRELSPSDYFGADVQVTETDAANDCAEACCTEGYTFLLAGTWTLEEPLKFGKTRFSNVAEIVGRTVGGDVAVNHTANRAENLALRRQVGIRCTGNATIIADFDAEEATPVIEYNLEDEGGAVEILGGLTITTPEFVDEDGAMDRSAATAPQDNNLTGLALLGGRGLHAPSPISILGMGDTGFLSVNSYSRSYAAVKAWACGKGANLSNFNGGEITVEPWYCGHGAYADGTNMKLRLSSAQQCDIDLRILRGECIEVEASYLEDYRPAEDGTGKYSVYLGEDAEAARLICCTFRGLRATPTSSGSTKKGFYIGDTVASRFIDCRDYGTGVDTDSISNAWLDNCEVTLTNLPLKRFPRRNSNSGGLFLPLYTAAEILALTASSRTGMIAGTTNGNAGSPGLAYNPDGSAFKQVSLGPTVSAT